MSTFILLFLLSLVAITFCAVVSRVAQVFDLYPDKIDRFQQLYLVPLFVFGSVVCLFAEVVAQVVS